MVDYEVSAYSTISMRTRPLTRRVSIKEASHPNVVLSFGLTLAPDGRVFIISELWEPSHLVIYNKTKPFPLRLYISLATDIPALAYLHPSKCVHPYVPQILLGDELDLRMDIFHAQACR